MDQTWLFLINVAIGIIVAVLGIPMAQENIKPNNFYGFRTKKTLSNSEIWYKANKYSGKLMIKSGIILALLSLILYFANLYTEIFNKLPNTAIYIISIGILCIFLIYLIVMSVKKLSKY